MKSPDEKHKLIKPDVAFALKALRNAGLLSKGPWISTVMNMIFDHPKPIEVAGGLLLLNHYLSKPLTHIAMGEGMGNFILRLLESFSRYEHPITLIAAYATLLPLEKYPYQVILTASAVIHEPEVIYAHNHDGLVVYEIKLSDKISLKVNSDIRFEENLHVLKLKILNDAYEKKFITPLSNPIMPFIFDHLLETSLPLVYAIAMTKVINLSLWKDKELLELLVSVSHYMQFWIQDVDFLELFMNFPIELMSKEQLISMCELSRDLDSISNGIGKYLLLKEVTALISPKESLSPSSKRKLTSLFESEKASEDISEHVSVYLNIFIQKAAFLKVITKDVSSLMGMKVLDLDNIFEIPNLVTLKPEF
jgi:hypothetical protein